MTPWYSVSLVYKVNYFKQQGYVGKVMARKVSKYGMPKEARIERAVNCLSAKGSIEILHCLDDHGTLRFNVIRQRLVGISPRTLAKRLHELENVGLINRRAYAEIPPRVEYCLTDRGQELALILSQAWKMFEEWYL